MKKKKKKMMMMMMMMKMKMDEFIVRLADAYDTIVGSADACCQPASASALRSHAPC